VTLVAADVSQNGVGRAYTLARLLARHFDVQLVGTAFGDGLWAPIRNGRFSFEVVRGRHWPMHVRPLLTLLGTLRGDVIYAVKPLPSSFGAALLHRRRRGSPLVLDVDDDELSFRPAPPWWNPRRLAASLADPNGRVWTRRLASRVDTADALTVASSALQQRLGGTLIPHARDTTAMRPRPEAAAEARRRLGVADGRAVILFAGTPRAHKGLEDVARAVTLMRHPASLVIAGVDEGARFTSVFRAANPGVVCHPGFPFEEAHLPLQAADAVVVPQRAVPQSMVQVPAKIVDAMAVARPIVATAVSDLPQYLAPDRGWIVPPSDPEAMARALDAILDDPAEAAARGQRARAWCVAHLSDDAVHETLAAVVRSAITRASTAVT